MEISVISEDSKRIEFELKGEDHTLSNLLKSKLWQNKHVKVATYAVKHPLVGIPRMIVETDGAVKPRKVLQEAAAKLEAELGEFRKTFRKVAR